MEKYAKLLKGLEKCAGPECCKDGCPYYGETRGGKTCRAWLLNDAAAAIENEEAGSDTLLELLHDTEAERDELKEHAIVLERVRTERDVLHKKLDKLNQDYTFVIKQRDELAADNNVLKEHCQESTKRLSDIIAANKALIDERDAMRKRVVELTEKLEAAEDETDRPSVCDKELMAEVGKLIAQAKYQEGRADTLAAIVERCSFGGGCCHE